MKLKFILAAVAALTILAGCSSKPYVGTYGINITPEQQKQMDAAPKELQGAMKQASEKFKLVLESGGTFTVTSPNMMTGKDETVEGTYTADGNKITMKVTKVGGKAPTGAQAQDNVMVYDPKEQTLSSDKGPGMTFKKK